MTVLSAQTIERLQPVKPLHPRRNLGGLSYGLGAASYDVRIAEAVTLLPGEFRLASTVERFQMPDDVCASVKDKSTLIRLGLHVHNTFIDPGWEGYLTLELKNQFTPPICPAEPVIRWWSLAETRRQRDWFDEQWIANVRRKTIHLKKGQPIAQIVFHRLDEPTTIPYQGKYQNQAPGAQAARLVFGAGSSLTQDEASDTLAEVKHTIYPETVDDDHR